MKLKSLVAAAALAAVSASSFAQTFSFDGSDELTFTFDVDVTGPFAAAVTSSVVNGYGFDVTSVTLDGNTVFTDNGVSSGGITADFFSYSAPSLSAGEHSISVFGTPLGSTYHGNVSAVPEPETYALMLAGLGIVGFVSRRRYQS